MASRFCGRLFRKKISSLIQRLSGNNERERRAYEEPEQIKEEKEDYLGKEINKIIASFSYGSFVYTYYAYMNKFNEEPKDWKNLFEYLEFNKLENKIKEIVSQKER